jgi:hypothetical protein
MNLFQLFLLITFLAGIYFYAQYALKREAVESMVNRTSDDNSGVRCPNVLLQKGARFYLYNSKLAIVPGVNPISFDNLEDYTEFIDWQHSQGIRCPVLYLQQTYDTQGKEMYKVRPGVHEPQGGMPPVAPAILTDSSLRPMSRPVTPDMVSEDGRPITEHIEEPAFNANKYNSYDSAPAELHPGRRKKARRPVNPSGVSPNPMDVNWGGAEYTQSLVDRGYYKNNEVKIYVP